MFWDSCSSIYCRHVNRSFLLQEGSSRLKEIWNFCFCLVANAGTVPLWSDRHEIDRHGVRETSCLHFEQNLPLGLKSTLEKAATCLGKGRTDSSLQNVFCNWIRQIISKKLVTWVDSSGLGQVPIAGCCISTVTNFWVQYKWDISWLVEGLWSLNKFSPSWR